MAFSASLVTGNTFVNGDSATATKLNNQVNLATFASTADNTFIAFDGSGNPIDGTAAHGLKISSGVLQPTFVPTYTTTSQNFTSQTPTAAASLQFTVTSGTTYTYEADLSCLADENGSIATGLFGTATMTAYQQAQTLLSSGTTKVQFGRTSSYANVGITQSSGSSGQPIFVRLTGYFTVNAGGTVNVIAALGAGGTTTATINAGSIFTIVSQ